jgi:hypothetical protein
VIYAERSLWVRKQESEDRYWPSSLTRHETVSVETGVAKEASGGCGSLSFVRVEPTSAGVLLVGVGSLLAALPRLIRPGRPTFGLAWENLAKPIERLHFSAESVGLIFVAIGAVVIAVNALHPWWFVLLVFLAACALVWCVAAWKLRQLWMMRAEQTAEYVQADRQGISPETLSALAQHNAGWLACLGEPFATARPWPLPPESAADIGTRLEPSHIAALRQHDARLEDANIPPEIQFNVENLRNQGITVTVVGDAVIAKAPNGQTAQISRSRVASRSTGSVLHRMRWLDDLEKIGARIQPGPQGKRTVAADNHQQDDPTT